ncbi:MAG TPA: ATP-binding protein [Thermoanaerobaculia bacterium]|nr:ATP-binding protein [Thermoanaerobaculia bacterium]
MTELPLGQIESAELELKEAGALRDLPSISAAVVAMLNAGRGEVWIGIRQEKGVGMEIEPVERPEEGLGRLLDWLHETIEPSLTREEVTAELVGLPQGLGAILRLSVKGTQGKRPYCAVNRGGRFFWLRVGGTTRLMTTDELAAHFSRKRSEEPQAHQVVDQEARRLDELIQSGFGGLWLHLEPQVPPSLDLASSELEALLEEPERTGNRAAGDNFFFPALPGSWELKPGNRLALGSPSSRLLVIEATGVIDFRVTMRSLTASTGAIDSLRLAELPTSVFRLARELHRQIVKAPEEELLDVELALIGLEGIELAPSISMTGHLMRHQLDLPRRLDEAGEVLRSRRTLCLRRLYENPDRCSFESLRQLYAAAGLEEIYLPPEFDRRTGRLMID